MVVTRFLFLGQILLPVLFCCGIACNAQNNSPKTASPTETASPDWQQKHDALATRYTAYTVEQRKQIRNELQKAATSSHCEVAPPGEPGTRIVLKGNVVDDRNQPVVGAGIAIYQTDARGYYTPLDSAQKRMGERDPRLFGFVKTDTAGNFTINTVRPSNYPLPYQGRFVPEHIHLDVSAHGFAPKNFQVFFDDDEALTSYWREAWAGNEQMPIVRLENSGEGLIVAILVLRVAP